MPMSTQATSGANQAAASSAARPLPTACTVWPSSSNASRSSSTTQRLPSPGPALSARTVQRIAQLVRQRGQELGLAAVGAGQVVGQALQGLVAPLFLGDVAQEDRHLALGRVAEARRVDVQPAIEIRTVLLDPHRQADARHPAIDARPAQACSRTSSRMRHPYAARNIVWMREIVTT